MKIAKNAVVNIDYTLRNTAGEVIDTSEGHEPLTYLHGHGELVPGLEAKLLDRVLGEALEVVVQPADGYGIRDESNVMEVPRTKFKGMDIEEGMQIFATAEGGGHIPFWITKIGLEGVTVDGNHPLAGQTLHFTVAIKGVRAATQEELQHGHVHGEGGHHHH